MPHKLWYLLAVDSSPDHVAVSQTVDFLLLLYLARDMQDKLVRDKIPEHISKDGHEAVTHEADESEYIERLCDKLVEEAEEYRQDRDVEELADIMQVILRIRRFQDISRETVQRTRRRKKSKNGLFKNRVVLEDVHKQCTYCSTVSDTVRPRTIEGDGADKPICASCFIKYNSESMQSKMHL